MSVSYLRWGDCIVAFKQKTGQIPEHFALGDLKYYKEDRAV